jgi:hypothetical protein
LTIYEPTVGKFSVKSNGESLELQFINVRYPGAIGDHPDIMVGGNVDVHNGTAGAFSIVSRLWPQTLRLD